MSSLMDTWLLRNVESNGERNRLLFVLKSRGSAHSNQVREFVLTDHGVELADVYVGPGGVMTGSARVMQQARERSDQLEREEQLMRRKRELKAHIAQGQAQLVVLQEELEAQQAELERIACPTKNAWRPTPRRPGPPWPRNAGQIRLAAMTERSDQPAPRRPGQG